ncbi:MAG TPA: ADP-ribosylation factor-like protein [Thermodesulfobacteriota bacterium]
MPDASAERRVVTSRIVVFGPAGAGTTTTLETIWRRMRADQRGQIVRQTLPTDVQAAYEVLPVDLGEVNGLHRRVQLATVPRGAANVGSRRQLLKGVDGVIFVADSAPERARDTAAAMRELSEHMAAYGRALSALPVVILLNKRDLPNALPSEQILKTLLDRLDGKRPPVFEGVATDGRGILNALSAVAKLVVAKGEGGPETPAARATVTSSAQPGAAPASPARVTLSAEAGAPSSSPARLSQDAPQSSVAVGTPRGVPGGLEVPLVVRDPRGGEHRLTLTLRIDPVQAGGATR